MDENTNEQLNSIISNNVTSSNENFNFYTPAEWDEED